MNILNEFFQFFRSFVCFSRFQLLLDSLSLWLRCGAFVSVGSKFTYTVSEPLFVDTLSLKFWYTVVFAGRFSLIFCPPRSETLSVVFPSTWLVSLEFPSVYSKFEGTDRRFSDFWLCPEEEIVKDLDASSVSRIDWNILSISSKLGLFWFLW